MNKYSDKSIAIIGAGITGLTAAYYLQKAGFHVTVLEQKEAVGGAIKTLSRGGFLYEEGPSSGMLSTIEMVNLLDEVSDQCTINYANNTSKQRWILFKCQWIALPVHIGQGISTPLFRWRDKVRLLCEPFRKRGENPDETVADLVKRRMGESFLTYAVNPFVGGIYAGDPDQLITRFALPKLYRLEQEYGSFVGGAIKKGREHKTADEKRVTREIFSVEGGLGKLINALATKIGNENILLNCQETTISQKEKGGYSVKYQLDNRMLSRDYDVVITTVKGAILPKILPIISPRSFTAITALRYAPVVKVAVGFERWNGKPLDAFGGLIPRAEKQRALGVLFPSSIFLHRSPEGGALLSVFLGGINDPTIIDAPDTAIKEMVKLLITSTLFPKTYSPTLVEIFRHSAAIPQYEKGSEERLKAIRKIEQQYENLYLAGGIRDGIGIADRVKQATRLAEAIIEREKEM